MKPLRTLFPVTAAGGASTRNVLMVLWAMAGLGCAMPMPRPPEAQLERLWLSHVAALQPVTHWDLRGRLAVRTDARGGQASLSWRREDLRHAIRLNGPLGRGVVRVTQDESGARLEDAEGHVHVAANAEQLLALYTGWQLPIAHLDWWLRGLPVPGIAATRELDTAGRLKSLRQQGWALQYQEYIRAENYDLPTRLTLVRDPVDSTPGLEARFVIDRWAQVK